MVENKRDTPAKGQGEEQQIRACARGIAEKVAKGAVDNFRQELQNCMTQAKIYNKRAAGDPGAIARIEE